jgi:hypothetical protein
VVASQILPRSISSSEKNHGLRFGGILKSICKEIALQGPKTGKFDYLSGLNHPAHSMAFKFFTDDYSSSFASAAMLSDCIPRACCWLTLTNDPPGAV